MGLFKRWMAFIITSSTLSVLILHRSCFILKFIYDLHDWKHEIVHDIKRRKKKGG